MPSWIGPTCALMLLAGLAPVDAAPATPEEAQRLTAVFERYLGHGGGQGGPATVVPQADSYKVTLDVGHLFAALRVVGLTVTAGVLAAELTPQADGQWRVVVDGLPEVGFTKDSQASSVLFEGYRLDGLFDPKIQAFSSASTQAGGSTSHATGPQGTSTVRFTGASQGTYGATDGGAGTINATTKQSIKNFRYDVDVAAGGDAAISDSRARHYIARGGGLDASFTIANARGAALNELWEFLVAHGSKDQLVADQTELKKRLKALLPFGSSAAGDIAVSNLAVSNSQGTFGIADLRDHYEYNGPASKDGVFSALKISGLTLPAGLFPGWSSVLWPTGLDISQGYGPITVTPALSTLIDNLDLGAEKLLTDEQIAAVSAGLSQGERVVHIPPSTVSTALATLRFEGDLRISRPLPTGTANISITGLDRSIDRIRELSQGDPGAAQIIALMSSLKVLAKAEGADNYSWRIEARPGGDLTVNGNRLSPSAPKAKNRQNPATLEP